MLGRICGWPRTLGLALLLGMSGGAPTLAAECVGRNLMDALPAGRMAEIRARADAAPFARGLLWQATKGEARIVLVGTYHFGDDRLDPMLDRLRPEVAGAAALLVEAGPTEEAALEKALRADPTLMADPTGPTLPERLDKPDWDRLSAAMTARGVPAVVTSRLRPWYVATMLGLSPCMLRQAAEGAQIAGLDHRLIDAAGAAGTPVRALEPWDTLFKVFSGMTPREEVEMIRSALPQAEQADDYATTLTDAYFDGEVWLLWEFGRFDAYDTSGLSRSEVDEMMDLTQRQLMDSRNSAWIAPLTQAAEAAGGAGKPVVAAFGALHLPGEHGVLKLLQDRGWTISPLDPATPQERQPT